MVVDIFRLKKMSFNVQVLCFIFWKQVLTHFQLLHVMNYDGKISKCHEQNYEKTEQYYYYKHAFMHVKFQTYLLAISYIFLRIKQIKYSFLVKDL